MKTIRTLLVDDEPLALRGLRLRLQTFEDIKIVGECSNGREAIQKIREEKPDLLFLDIQMPGLDGFSVMRSMIGEVIPIVVFVTAFDNYALKAFEAHALDYLLKPVAEDRLLSTIERVRKQIVQHQAVENNARVAKMLEDMEDPPKVLLSAVLEKGNSVQPSSFEKYIHIKDRGHITRVTVDDIFYIDAAGDYMCIHTPEKTHILRATMKAMSKRLDPKIFQRVHRSAIVNMEKVKEVHPHANGEYFLTMENDREVKVSRSYRDVIARFL